VRSRSRRTFWGTNVLNKYAFLLLTVVWITPLSVSATVVEELSLEELTDEATHVVRARVGAQYVHPERGQRGEIYTRTELTVLGYLKGEGPPQMTVQQLGGEFGTYRLSISGNATLRPGDEVVVFLSYDDDADLSYVVALSQGLYRVVRTQETSWVERDLSGLSFYTAGAVPYELPSVVQALSDLEVRIKGGFGPGDLELGGEVAR